MKTSPQTSLILLFSLTDVALRGCSFAICNIPGACLASSSFSKGATLVFGEISLLELCVVSVQIVE